VRLCTVQEGAGSRNGKRNRRRKWCSGRGGWWTAYCTLAGFPPSEGGAEEVYVREGERWAGGEKKGEVGVEGQEKSPQARVGRRAKQDPGKRG